MDQAMMYLGGALAMGLAALGGTLSLSKAAACAFEGISRNPESSEKMFIPFILSLALIESQVILAFIIAIIMIS